MSGTLDKFWGIPQTTAAEQRCDNPKCRKILGPTVIKYVLTGKHAGHYCQECAQKILHPQENAEENL